MSKITDVINQRIMELLGSGTVPWRKTWNAASNQPKNLVSKKDYRGINVFLLACMPYSSPYWMTYKQVSDKGGHVRKGEKSTIVIFWKWLDKKDAGGDDADTVAVNGKIPRGLALVSCVSCSLCPSYSLSLRTSLVFSIPALPVRGIG